MGRHRPDHPTGEPMDEGFGAIVKNCKKFTRLAVSGLLSDRCFGLHWQVAPSCKKLEIRDCLLEILVYFSGIHHYYNMRSYGCLPARFHSRAAKEVAQRLPHLVVEVIMIGWMTKTVTPWRNCICIDLLLVQGMMPHNS
ncbi:hypothetical protein HPP92_009009 [Vanilla planifolia]|uniref:Uncharacterized protein n=1 Tax=Vanilla planifolia TaxID=51239 RepID=A0A835RDG6_VANPL|nr:hypothetical protein HPP92_009009 [Vanilla planifolia]